MKAIYAGGDDMFHVYDEKTQALLLEEAGLEAVNYKKEEIIASPEKFKDTEIIFSTWGMFQMTEEEISKYLPNLKAVFYGAGSVQAFARPFLNSGVRVFSAWGANAVPVKEYTLAQILLANKGFFLACRMSTSIESRKIARDYAKDTPGNFDTNVGIIGAGMIGKMVIRELLRNRLNVLVHDPFLSDEKANELGVKKVSLEELFESCQTISNHVANLPETVGMLTYDHFRRMKPNATFINTGRGAQVVEADLIRALREVPTRTAILDVTFPEPPEEGSPFYEMPNVFLTPHLAGSAGQEVARMGEYMLDQYRKYAGNEPCEYEVSLEMLKTMA